MLTVNRRTAQSIAVIVQRCSNPNRLLISYLEKGKRQNRMSNREIKSILESLFFPDFNAEVPGKVAISLLSLL